MVIRLNKQSPLGTLLTENTVLETDEATACEPMLRVLERKLSHESPELTPGMGDLLALMQKIP